jgi:ferredoxin-thioredoxin reductase catalytic chain
MWPLKRRPDPALDDAIRKAERLVRKYAGYAPYELVGDPVVLRNLIRGLARNWVRHGLPYCPCKPVTGDRARDRTIVCPCKAHHDEIARDGACCCGLFLKR